MLLALVCWTLHLIEKLHVKVIIFMNLVLLLLIVIMKRGVDEIDLAVKGDLWVESVGCSCMYVR